MSQPPPAGPPPIVYVTFSAEVVPHTAEALIANMAEIASHGVREVHLLISTPGGSVMYGMNVYNVLRALPFKLVTHNVGNVDSIGNPIFLAGEERYACEHSTFMFHGVGFDIPAQARLEEKALTEHLEGLRADQKRIGSVISEHTDLGPEQIEGFFLKAKTLDAAEARSFGIVHEVKDAQIPRGSAVRSLVFQR